MQGSEYVKEKILMQAPVDPSWPKWASEPSMRTAANLLTKHALTLMRSRGPEFAAGLAKIENEAARSATYPDGTRLIQGGDSLVKLHRLTIENRLLVEGDLPGWTRFPTEFTECSIRPPMKRNSGTMAFTSGFPSCTPTRPMTIGWMTFK